MSTPSHPWYWSTGCPMATLRTPVSFSGNRTFSPWFSRHFSHTIGPAYQAGSTLRLVWIVQAYLTKAPMDYHDAIMPIHGFVYTRSLLFLFGLIGKSSPPKDNRSVQVSYAEAVICAGCISVSHCSHPWAVCLYLGVFTLCGGLGQWTSARYAIYPCV